jgi:exonuclease III
MVSQSLEKNIKNAYLIPQAVHSDHCPVALELSV